MQYNTFSNKMKEARKSILFPNPDNLLKLEANSFYLEANLSDEKLSITLKDYTEWILYSKQLTEADVAGQNNQNISMHDIFIIMQAAGADTYEKKDNFQEQIEYQFGEIIKKYGVPGFKIEKGGKITVYKCLFDKMIKKDIIFELKLNLNKQMNMPDIEILQHKHEKQIGQYICKIQLLERNNQTITANYLKIQKQNKKLYQKLEAKEKRVKQFIISFIIFAILIFAGYSKYIREASNEINRTFQQNNSLSINKNLTFGEQQTLFIKTIQQAYQNISNQVIHNSEIIQQNQSSQSQQNVPNEAIINPQTLQQNQQISQHVPSTGQQPTPVPQTLEQNQQPQ